MAAPAITFDSLRRQIAAGKQLSPVYVLHGEEGYYIDELVKEFERVLPEADREFNQYVLYAPQTDARTVTDIAGGYPMMGERQVVIVKEMQAASAQMVNALASYVRHPSPTTVLVLVFRGQKAKGKDLLDAAKATKAVIFESARVRDYQIPRLVEAYIREKGLGADAKAVSMLAEFIGTDLSRLYNEIDKLVAILGAGATVTPESVERNIGVSKDYNNFELIDALSVRNAEKCFRITRYFASNPKSNPVPVTIAALYGYFSDLLCVFYSPDKSERGIMQMFKLKAPIQARRYVEGIRHYNAFQTIEAIWALRQCDCRSKGRGSRQDPALLLNDLVFHILSAPGNLGI